MKKQDLIQKLINKINAESYVEIGLGSGDMFKSIKCPKKYGIDPQFGNFVFEKGARCSIRPTHEMTSDQFFEQNKETFDVIFIDGMHESEYVERDINNSLNALNDNGFIICHDMSPTSKNMQIVPRIQPQWTGDCWKAWVKIRSTNPNINMFVVDTDYGCGVIQKGSQKLLDLQGQELTYENLDKNREEWLNLISVNKFLNFL
jgi:hypothetical protein